MEKSFKVIVFELEQKLYGIHLEQVLSIERMQTITELPVQSTFIKGIINLRGNIIPIINLRERLDLGQMDQMKETRILIVQIHTARVGLIVDNATDVVDLDPSSIEPAPDIIGGMTRKYLKGVAKLKESLLVLLEIKHVLNFEDKEEIQEIVQEGV